MHEERQPSLKDKHAEPTLSLPVTVKMKGALMFMSMRLRRPEEKTEPPPRRVMGPAQPKIFRNGTQMYAQVMLIDIKVSNDL